jgi:hypothetical protein
MTVKISSFTVIIVPCQAYCMTQSTEQKSLFLIILEMVAVGL